MSFENDESVYAYALHWAFWPRPLEVARGFEDRWGTYPHAGEYARQIDGKTWEELDPHYLATRVDALELLRAPLFADVLPAYLKVLFERGPATPIGAALLPLLIKSDAADAMRAQQFDERVRYLHAPHRGQVAAALEHVVAAYPADAALARDGLERFWARGRTSLQQIASDVRAAFPPLQIDGTEAFRERGRTYADASEYSRQLDGKTWEQLDARYLAQQSDALSFLGDRHWLAVLPAYLNLLFVLGPMSLVPGTLILELTKPEAGAAAREFEALVDGLTEIQRSAVATALRRFVTEYPHDGERAQIALDRYWSSYLAGG